MANKLPVDLANTPLQKEVISLANYLLGVIGEGWSANASRDPSGNMTCSLFFGKQSPAVVFGCNASHYFSNPGGRTPTLTASRDQLQSDVFGVLIDLGILR